MKTALLTLSAVLLAAGAWSLPNAPRRISPMQSFLVGSVPEAPAQYINTAYMRRLQSTLESELYARDYYDAAYLALGTPRFANLASAEQRHADSVVWMITYLGGHAVPFHRKSITPPTSLAEADAVCEAIELYVIAVYDGLIRDCPDPALLQRLNNIQDSNHNHLAAVQ